ncbi:MAG: hypothetical protein QXU97_04890 [Fervidicoccaceae archaeon]
MPKELIFESIEELQRVARPLAERAEECRLKWGGASGAKLKFRTRRTLYTAVITPEKIGGAKSEGEFRERIKRLAQELGCKKLVEIE